MLMNVGITSALCGVIVIIIQILLPDLVPDALINILSDNASANFTGVRPILKATLALWYIGGFALLLAGITATFIGYRRSQSE